METVYDKSRAYIDDGERREMAGKLASASSSVEVPAACNSTTRAKASATCDPLKKVERCKARGSERGNLGEKLGRKS